MLQYLEVRAVRNLIHICLEFSPEINLIVGANASGKTSLLEAIHLLGLARSFRSHKIQSVIHAGSDVATVFGRIRHGEAVVGVGVSKSREGETVIRIGGKTSRSVAELAHLLPLQVMIPASHMLVEAGPKHRRAFLDWGVFHVEHAYYEVWQRYVRAIKQRNAALRSGGVLEPWDRELVESGEAMDAMRQRYVGRLQERTKHYLDTLLPGAGIALRYARGWGAAEQGLREALGAMAVRDRELGHTTVGPHRADLRLLVEGRSAGEILSRGQQKLLVAALRLAQVDILKETGTGGCVVLVDDLAAELDRTHREQLMGSLARLGVQVFVTATDSALIDLSAWSNAKLFHVEHGQVREMV